MATTESATSCTAEQCSSLLIAAGISVLSPNEAAYEDCIASYWCHDAKLRPWCIAQPRTAEEVSKTVQTLVKAGCNFAIRSGGHTTWAGSNSIEAGVTIDLSLINATTLRDDSKIASIGPGARWRDVYTALEPHELVVAGGRDGDVGVGGLLTGGGLTYFTARVGMACDNVVNFEVVLADGRIVEANDKTNPDLFQVLKGGSNNFGIVTRFDMQTIENKEIWGGTVFYPNTATPHLVDALVDFTDNIDKNSDSSCVGVWTYMPQTKDIVVMGLFTNVDGLGSGPAFKKFLAAEPYTPNLKEITTGTLTREISLPPGQHEIWFTLTFKNDARIVTRVIDSHAQLVDDLKTLILDGNFTTQCILQPLPTIFAQHSVARGGNILGMDQIDDNAILWLGACSVPTPTLAADVRARLKTITARLEEYATELGANIPWRYLNYANPSQEVLATYGMANVRKMRAAAAKYDPAGVFQTMVPGGFKISKVR